MDYNITIINRKLMKKGFKENFEILESKEITEGHKFNDLQQYCHYICPYCGEKASCQCMLIVDK